VSLWRHAGDKVERTFDIQATASTVSATKSTVLATESTELVTVSTTASCQIQVVADLSPKLATKSTGLLVLATVDLVVCVYWALEMLLALC